MTPPASSIVYKEMETKQPWNWRLTVPKTTKMTLVRPAHDQLPDDWQSWLCRFSPLSIKFLIPCLLVCVCAGAGSWPLDRCLTSPAVASIWNKANFSFYQHGMFTGFWALSNQTPPFSNNRTHCFQGPFDSFVSMISSVSQLTSSQHPQTTKKASLPI